MTSNNTATLRDDNMVEIQLYPGGVRHVIDTREALALAAAIMATVPAGAELCEVCEVCTGAVGCDGWNG